MIRSNISDASRNNPEVSNPLPRREDYHFERREKYFGGDLVQRCCAPINVLPQVASYTTHRLYIIRTTPRGLRRVGT